MTTDNAPGSSSDWERSYDVEQFRQWGHQLIDFLASRLSATLQGDVPHVLDYAPPDTLLNEFRQISRFDDFLALVDRVWQSSIRLHHPHYVGHQVSPTAPVAALAGLVGDWMNNGMAVYEMGMSATAMERVVLEITAQRIGFPPEAQGVLTSGGSLANLTALLAARSRLGDDVWQHGTHCQYGILVSDQAHYSIDRAIRIMGWGHRGIVPVPVDEHFRMRVDALPEINRRAREEGIRVIGVVGNACSTATGTFDRLDAIADYCSAERLWFHVDGAHGVAAAFAPEYRPLLQGIERADSVSIDYHKLLMAPALSSAILFRQGRESYRVFSQAADYLWSNKEQEEWYTSGKKSFECTKTMMSFKIYSLFAILGFDVLAAHVRRLHELGQTFAEMLRSAPDFELATWPQSNILCFRHVPSEMAEESLNEWNAQIRMRLRDRGEFYLVQTTLQNRLWLRTTLSNPYTTPAILQQLLDAIREEGRRVASSTT